MVKMTVDQKVFLMAAKWGLMMAETLVASLVGSLVVM